jgi:hypothetical protein
MNSQALTISGKHMSIPYSSENDQSSTPKNDRDSKDDKDDG